MSGRGEGLGSTEKKKDKKVAMIARLQLSWQFALGGRQMNFAQRRYKARERQGWGTECGGWKKVSESPPVLLVYPERKGDGPRKGRYQGGREKKSLGKGKDRKVQ